MKLLLTLIGLVVWAGAAHAETVFVKYRGPVELDRFACSDTPESSLVNRVCYDEPNSYMLIQLNGTFYHYCRIGSDIVGGLLSASSKGKFYNSHIKGQFDCRLGGVPE